MGDFGLQILFLLPAVGVEPLPEVSLAVKQAHTDEWNSQIGRALDVIAREDAETTRILWDRFMYPEFSGEISYWMRPQNAGVPCAPSAVALEIFSLAAIGIVNPAVQHELGGTPLDFL